MNKFFVKQNYGETRPEVTVIIIMKQEIFYSDSFSCWLFETLNRLTLTHNYHHFEKKKKE